MRGSPMRKDVPVINDCSQLARLMHGTEKRVGRLDHPVSHRDTFTSLSASPQAISRFQPAIKPSAHIGPKEVIQDGLVVKDYATTLKEWNVEPFIDAWAESVRKWLSTNLMESLMKRIASLDEKLKSAGFEHLGCINQSTDLLAWRGPQPNANPLMRSQAGPPQTLQQLVESYPNEDVTKERVKLERYLTIGKYTCRAYILHRINMLSHGSCLAQFQWSVYQPFEGKEWTSEKFPTDAEIIMSLFCSFLSEHIEKLEPHKQNAFAVKHFLPVGAKPPASKTIAMIREQSKVPVHYQFIVDNIIWDIYPNRNNLFQTLALFVYYVKSACSGYIDLLYLGSKAVGLLDIVSTGPLLNRFLSPRKK